MALRILFQFGILFAIGFCWGPTSILVRAIDIPNANLSLQLKNPKDVIVAKGQNALLRCDSKSTTNDLKVTWYFNGSKLYPNDTKRQQLNNGSLYVKKVIGGKRSDVVVAGEYSCLVENRMGALLSNPAKLRTASIDRNFLKEPQNTTVYQLQPIILFCNIHSTPVADIRWELNNLPLPHSTRYVPLPSGALLITNSQFSDSGSYRCIATNNILKKSKTSKTASLTVLSALNQVAALSFLPLDISPNRTVLVGDLLELYCPVIGWPIPTVQWLNNNSIVIGNTTVLTIPDVNLHDAGNYTCMAYNSNGRISQKFVVDVHEPPHFNFTPTSKTYPSAKTARLDCQAIGVPEPRIYWLKNGKPLAIAGRIKKQPTGLVFSHTFTYDSGIYQCVAVNAAGKIWSAAEIVMSISNSPKPPENVQCRPFDNSSVCLTWQPPKNVTAQAYSCYSFYNNDKNEEISGPEFVTNKTSQLAIGLNTSTNYSFYVRLYSKVASDQSKRVTCRAGVIGERQLRGRVMEDNTSVALEWNEVSWDNPCNDTGRNYTVQWRRDGQWLISYEYTNDLKYVVTGLLSGVEYDFRVQANYYVHDDSWIKIKLPGEEDMTNTNDDYDILNGTDLEQITGIATSATSVKLTWTDLDASLPPESKYYQICYVDVTDRQGCVKQNILNSSSNSLEITKLKPNTVYEFKVKQSSGPFSKAVKVVTPPDVPSPIIGLEYKIINDTTICLRWQTPLYKNGELLNYLVTYTPDRNWPLDKWLGFSVAANATPPCWPGTFEHVSVLLGDLNVENKYTVLVRAVSNVGIGKPNVKIDVSTRRTMVGSELNSNGSEKREEIYYKQIVGALIGISIAIVCIICCTTCIVLRGRCIKRRALARQRLAETNNYYPAVAHYAKHSSSVQVRLEDPCAAEIHEIEHLVSDNHQTNIPPIDVTHLDTKGGEGFPNGHVNGSVKPYINGNIPNGHVHITENPQYYAFECNGHAKQSLPSPSFEEDSNSNVKLSKFYDLYRLFENSKKSLTQVQTPQPPQLSPTVAATVHYHQCNPHFEDSVSKIRLSKNGELNRSSSLESVENSLLNATQLTCLDDTIATSTGMINNHNRRISPVLGPNG